jgi:PAS domain S-box-containing protein
MNIGKAEGTQALMKTEARLSLLYFVFGFLWIFITDLIVVPLIALPGNAGELFDAYKGWLYVAVTAAGLYLILRREFRRRQDAETEALESKRLAERVIGTVPEAIQLIDLNDHKSIYLNEMARQIFSRASGPASGPHGKHIHPEDVPRFPDFMQRARLARENEILEMEYRLSDGSGNWRTMYERSVVFSRNPDGSVAQVLSIVRDITERKVAEEQLMFQVSLLNNVSDAIISVDADTRVTTWNPAAETIYGYSAAEALGQTLQALIQTEFGTLTREEFLHNVNSYGHWRGEVTQRRKDGARIDAYNASTLLRDRHGEIIGLVSVLRDMTEQKQLQDETRKNEVLRLDLEREIEARTLRSRFMSTVSHEFRTPLTTIQLAAELLEHYFERMTPSGRKERLAQIEIEVKRLLTMLDDILIVLKTEGTGQYFSPACIDLVPLVNDVISQFQIVLPAPERLMWKAESEASDVLADPKILRQAIVNLVSNALKYSPSNTPVEVRLIQNGIRVSVSVQDYGIGIVPADLKHLGEAFYRGTNVTNIPGTGLGLLITQQAIELHGGSLEIDSEVGKGTTATIHLPLAEPEQQTSVPHP